MSVLPFPGPGSFIPTPVLSAIGAVPGTAAGEIRTPHRDENSVPQLTVYSAPASDACAPRLPLRTWPVWLTRAQCLIEPPSVRASSFDGVIEPFAIFFAVTAPLRSCLLPTLPAGRLKAAYDVPPS